MTLGRRPANHMSVPEVQRALGISRQRVYQLIGWGRLPHTKVGRLYFIPSSAVEDRQAADDRLSSKQCVTTQEVADFFGVETRTVRDWYANGALRGQKINNRLCFNPGDVIAFHPPYLGGVGRSPTRTGTRTLWGRHYPADSKPPEDPSKGTPIG